MPATVALSACWLSVDLSWLGSWSSIDMKLLFSVQRKNFPSISNKARGTKVAANMPLSSSILDLSEPRSSYRHIVKVILHFHIAILSASLCFTGFREFYQVFNSTFFILAQRLTSVVLMRSSSKAVYFCWSISPWLHMYFVTFGSITTFVMILINSSSSCVIGFKKDLITIFNVTMS